MRTHWKLAFLAAALAALAACGSCKPPEADGPPATAVSFLPAGGRSAVMVPDVARLGRTARALEQTKLAGLAASALGARDAHALVAPVVRQLGFDPRTDEGFAKAGLDGTRGLAFGDDGAGGQILVLAVADPGRFDGYLATLARRFGGDAKGEAIYAGTEEAPAKVPVVTFSSAGGEPRLAYGIRDGFAVIGTGARAVESVGAALTRPRGESLDADPAFGKARRKLASRDLYAWLPRGVGEGRAKRFAGGVAIGASVGEKGLNLRLLLPQGPLQVAAIHAMGKPAGMEVARLLSADDFLAVRLGGEPAAYLPALEATAPRRLLSSLREVGFEPADVLAQLRPGAALGIELNPEVDLSSGLPTDPSIARTNPFSFFRVVLVAKVKDPAKAAAMLETLAEKGGAFGMQVAKEGPEDARVYEATYAAGEGMTWGLVGDTLLAAGGTGTFEKARARLGAEAPGEGFVVKDPAARRIFETAGSAAHLDVQRLTAALREIPPSAYGIGGFRLKELMDTWVGLLGELKGVTASLSIDEEGLIVDADLGLE
ncbi:MAG TPA: hypothetical protein VN033_09585 [Vulgatibacter sp.]|nr:hypothetical protein [Vulgatibacter sp.]